MKTSKSPFELVTTKKTQFKLTTPEGGKLALDPWQKEVITSKATTRVCVCARQVGKTTALLVDMIYTAYKNPGAEMMLVVPVYKVLDPILTKLYRMVPPFVLKYHNKQQGFLTLGQPQIDEFGEMVSNRTIGTIWLRSADRPDTLRGPTLHSLYMDEATVVQDPTVWYEVLEPMLAMARQEKKGGRALLAGTPKGTAQWMFDLYKRGQMKSAKKNASWKITAHDCPRYSKSYINEMRDKLSEASFNQEYLAEWVNSEGRFFRTEAIRECIQGDFSEPEQGRKYIVGADFGRKIDYSVFVVMDMKTNRVVAFDRMKLLPYPIVEQRLATLALKYNDAVVVYDATQRSGDIRRSLHSKGLRRLVPIIFTNTSKTMMMETLSLAIEKNSISFPEIDPLIRELEIFQVVKTTHGKFQYRAPKHMHDDCVDALALCLYGRRRALRKPCGRINPMQRIRGRHYVERNVSVGPMNALL